jgi:ribosomal protein S18 acetylase RimI-like enzyme
LGDWALRDANESDISAVLALWDAAGSTRTVTDDEHALAALLATDPRALIVAGSDGRVVGSLIAGWDGWRASFYRLAVHPEWRRRGLGRELVRAGERRLRERGARRLTAIAAAGDPLAMRFWAALGYKHQPDHARFVRDAARDHYTS